jgi:nitroimidazol reductase NimA-like FMN-containing flavoprotein (pyridoxamine 5'-phosphate oxidase superfamily)
MSTAMTRAEREAFLADVHVGVLAIADDGRGPLAAPIWYAYEPGGDVWFVTGRDSRKGRRLAVARRASLVAQSEAPPYKYVSVEGPIVGIERPELEKHLRPLARRYLGDDLGDRYVEQTRGDADESVLVRIRPQRWLTVDYSKQWGA